MGPEAGAKGGRIIAQGNISTIAADPASQIGPFLFRHSERQTAPLHRKKAEMSLQTAGFTCPRIGSIP